MDNCWDQGSETACDEKSVRVAIWPPQHLRNRSSVSSIRESCQTFISDDAAAPELLHDIESDESMSSYSFMPWISNCNGDCVAQSDEILGLDDRNRIRISIKIAIEDTTMHPFSVGITWKSEGATIGYIGKFPFELE